MEGRQLRPGRPLLAGSARRRASVVLACCAAIVAALGVLVSRQTTADWFDRAVDAPVLRLFGGHHGLALWLASPGGLAPAVILSAAVVVTCLLTGRLNGAVLSVVAIPAAVELDERLLKPLVHRTYHGSLVYPSGHTTAVAAFAAMVAVLLLVPPHQARFGVLRVLITAAACLLVVVVAIGLIGLGWHYFTDTVAGAAVGIGTVCAVALILDLPGARRVLAWGTRERATAREPG